MHIQSKRLGGYHAEVLHHNAFNLSLVRAVSALLAKIPAPEVGEAGVEFSDAEVHRDQESYIVFSRRLAFKKFWTAAVLFDEIDLSRDILHPFAATAKVCFGHNVPGRDDIDYAHWKKYHETRVEFSGDNEVKLIHALANEIVAYVLTGALPEQVIDIDC